jgi:hypothetical protein
MARQRRGGFGTLLRTTLAQAGGLRDVLERGAREGRARLDDALAGRRRTEALAELGEVVLDLIRRGEIELDQLPEAAELVEQLEALDAEHPPEEDERSSDRAPARSPARASAGTSGRPSGRTTGRTSGRDDGTVASTKWVAPAKKAAAAAASRIWRPLVEPDDPPTAPSERPAPKKLGGISFAKDDDDSDLAEYMHPDDVPLKAK